MDKKRKVFQPKIKRDDALTLWAALNNVTSSQAGTVEHFISVASFNDALGSYFAFTEADADAAEAPRNVSALHRGRTPFLYQ